ncbi:AAA family ATPase [Neobacillus cucumis]|uniref:Chromosome segregation protein SMC n=1 Tax=Neobacillus cucumis TaxID=1740721 RepID=A0A2N5HAB6_9BACI|nr:AAA family ATPase [Neobacillus cucumis]PLS02454.1 chromosome segregation protein SMC [Neobacillus cucumis]
MIPWRLTFTGIRDYRPTLIDLSGVNEHVMITGPNGAGKSTITFCMGAVLYSSKVAIEGLKSRNLSPDQTWKSRITLLFNNSSLMKIDAPRFIEFSLNMVQEPGQPIKKEYWISTGEEMDQWDETIRYSSGDRIYNFSAYRHALQYKYKIDPDLFYLIWYQQEVNQFAVMSPEERFRIFSEMHGIDKTQRDWEESIEKLKDTEESLRYAETNVKIKKQELTLKKRELDHYHDHQQRLNDGAKQYIEALLNLEHSHIKEIEKDKEIQIQLMTDLENCLQKQMEAKVKKDQNEAAKQDLKQSSIQLNLQIQEIENKIITSQNKAKQLREDIVRLEEELSATSAKKNRLTRSEEEVKLDLKALKKQQSKTLEDLKENQEDLKIKKDKFLKEVEVKIKLTHEIEANKELEFKHQECLRTYTSSHIVQETLDHLDMDLEHKKDLKHVLSNQLKELENEQDILRENRMLSSRQIESLKLLKIHQIKAYPLRELIQLDSTAQLQDEKLFNAIKYTIFFNGKEIIPPNDLYHVSLKGIIPDRSITKLPILHLEVKDGLPDVDLPFAMKALWWVEQFFNNQEYTIKNDILIDRMGIRGPQEKEKYILSEKALKARKEKVAALLEEKQKAKDSLEEEIVDNTKKIRHLNSVIQSVKEAEAFMTKEYERLNLKRKLDEVRAEEKNLKSIITVLETSISHFNRLIIEQSSLENILKEEEEIYQEIGQMKERFQFLTQLKASYTEQEKLISKMKTQRDILDDQYDKVSRDIKHVERKIGELQEELDIYSRDLRIFESQKRDAENRIELSQMKLIQYMDELTNLQKIHSSLYQKIISNVKTDSETSIQQMMNKREEGLVKFNHALDEEVDPAAPENYEAVKKEFERLDNECNRTKILLAQDQERTDQLKDHLEKTVNMRVLEIQQRFKSYMAHFQFDGEISWESYEDRQNRTHFKLFIKARKEGHRGVMEDVSVKARGGKVGKGVSGGEESLSSLLFALALLQNLKTSPGFIVLDEFDSALDENRKSKVFDLYVQELQRKLIILTPKSHEETYLNRFKKAFVVHHDPTIPQSKVVGLVKTEESLITQK